jgi:hypothetical protein
MEYQYPETMTPFKEYIGPPQYKEDWEKIYENRIKRLEDKKEKQREEYEEKQKQWLEGGSSTTMPIDQSRFVATKTWPGNPEDENEFTDPDENRENRDISRDSKTEDLKYRNT